MAVSAWLVWRRRGLDGAWRPLSLNGLRLALNLAWTWLFFALRRPGPAFSEIVLLWATILATLVTFGRVRRAAGWLLIPYLAWVAFAALSFAIWRLNRRSPGQGPQRHSVLTKRLTPSIGHGAEANDAHTAPHEPMLGRRGRLP